MDDFVVNVRQITQYPQKDAASPTDAILLQQGGLGGPYAWATPAGLLAALQSAGVVGIGVPPPSNAADGQLFVKEMVLPPGGTISWNIYQGTNLQPWMNQWPVGWMTLDQAGFSINGGDGPSPLMLLDMAGNLTTSGDVLAQGNQKLATETLLTQQINLVVQNSVLAWMGRTGNVTMYLSDILEAGGAAANNTQLRGIPTAPDPVNWDQADNQIATTRWVQINLNSTIKALLACHNFVFTFEGRTGAVLLQTADVNRAYFVQDGFTPQAPTPPLSDYSNRLATTRFVATNISDLEASMVAQLSESREQVINYITGGYAPLHDAVLTGVPTAPTAPPGTNTGQLATTAFVQAAVAASVAGVASFNNRTGHVVFTVQDVSDVGGALLASPTFTGNPAAPTPAVGDNSTSIATTAFVMTEIAAMTAGVSSFNGRSGAVNLTLADVTTAGGAPVVSPTFTGAPAAPTATVGTSTTQIATTAFVQAALGGLNTGVATFNGRTGAVTFNVNDLSAVGGALLASPAFTGVPTAPTASPNTNTIQIATTAFVQAALAGGGVVTTFNGRGGAVTLTAADVVNASGALLVYSATAPTGAASKLWWNTTDSQLYIWDTGSSAWVVAVNRAATAQ